MRAMRRVQASPKKKPKERIKAPVKLARKEPRQERSRVMVEMLMRATTRVLIRDGYEGLTTNRVAEEAGASVGSLYQYFSSKQQLVSALLNQHIEHTMHELRSALPELSLLSLAEAVPRFVELMIASHRVEPELHRVFYEQLPRVGDFATMEASLRESQQLTEAYLRARAHEITPQDHAMSAFILVHTIETLTHAAVLSRPEMLRTDAFANELSELVLRYLQPGRGAKSRKA